MSEHTIAENLARLTAARTNIANAITAKGGTANSGDGLEEFPTDIATIPSGGGGSTGTKDVNFYDYDGTIVDGYTSSEFATLTEMPNNPSHEGLTAQGWNWSLTDAKAYVAKYGKLNIGQMYNTDDGALRIYIRLEEGRLSPVLGLCPNGTLTVDWGDGSPTETMVGSSSSTLVYLGHTYASSGDYVINVLPNTKSKISFGQRNNCSTILCKSPSDNVNSRRVYLNAIYRIELHKGAVGISDYAFSNCYALTSVMIPDSVTSISGYAFSNCYALSSVVIPDSVMVMSDYAFYYCYNLTSVTIPDSVTRIGSSAFQYCHALTSVIIPDSVTSISASTFQACYALTSVTIPDSVTGMGTNAFYYCYSLTSVTIPDGVTSISDYAFQNCYALTSVVIPDSVTRIGNYAFQSCVALTSVTIPDSVTSIGSYAFYYCYALSSVMIPDSVTSISNNTFQYCYALTSVTIPDSVTSIGNTAFDTCLDLISVTIPDSVTSIGSNTFRNCYGLGYIKFTSTTPPTVSNSSTWSNVPTDCIIYVPTGYLEDYEDATNFPDPDAYQYVEY